MIKITESTSGDEQDVGEKSEFSEQKKIKQGKRKSLSKRRRSQIEYSRICTQVENKGESCTHWSFIQICTKTLMTVKILEPTMACIHISVVTVAAVILTC
ncbi:hypothetical protein HAX54_000545 [Datura stramonium]|uniref:Uncharacterized protein n=1 Tax=Datura stramonium TaxID=4076 RepID=A0ABS8T3F2_DATST|nr:hypothetical protein [Datura stramonium]